VDDTSILCSNSDSAELVSALKAVLNKFVNIELKKKTTVSILQQN
jgi:hypothetical protein